MHCRPTVPSQMHDLMDFQWKRGTKSNHEVFSQCKDNHNQRNAQIKHNPKARIKHLLRKNICTCLSYKYKKYSRK